MIKMRENGYEMIAVSSPGVELDELREKDGFKTYEVPMSRHISLWGDIKSLINMIRVFGKERPYVVHSITPKAGLICMVAAWLTRVPVRIHMFTGLIWPMATGFKRRVLMATDWLTCACATHIIPEGQGVLNDLKNGGITRKPLKVLGYGNVKGIDLEKFDPDRFTKNKHDTFDYLFVGRIVGDKGINELVEAFTKLHDEHPKTRLILVGYYEKELDPVSKLTMDRITANSAIIVAGSKWGDELLQAYVDADCFVMPSYREGFPNTVIEAGAMRLPQVATDINGSREIVSNEENGLIVPSKDVKALYDAMERILIDDDLRNRLVQESRPMIETRFEKNFVQGCLIDFYKEVLY